jgi:imidazolonepropionase-like amidohydrolase
MLGDIVNRLNCFLPAVLLLGPTTARSQPPAILNYAFLMAGNAAGRATDTIKPDGSIEVEYSYNDRGRGPEIRGSYRFDPRGFPSSVELAGHDYLKAEVDERLSVKDGEARWKSRAEQGQARAQGYYVSVNGPPAEAAWMVNALLKAPNHAIGLLPAGEARLERGTEAILQSGGRTLKVTQFLITGLAFTPASVWLDPENHFFAQPSPWFTAIRSGWESTADQLINLETTGENTRYSALAQRLGRHPKSIVIHHVRVFDAVAATARENQTVRIADGRIEAVGPDNDSALPAAGEVIDGRGKTLLPGLWDMHAHIDPSEGMLNIASGVTSVRDMANDIDMLQRLRKQYDSGETIGPRIFMCGFIDGRGPYQGPTKVFADSEEEARAAIERYASLGYRQIKVYSSLKPELFPAIVKMAHARQMRVSGHVPNGMTAERFVREGADEIQHMNFIFLNFMAEKVEDTRTPARFTVVAENAAALDQQSARVTAFIALLKEKKIVVDPTLGVFEGMFTDRPGQMSASWAPVLSRLPAQVQRAAFQGGLPAAGEKDQLYNASYQAMLRMTKRLYEAGVPLVAGTDGVEGLMLHRELEIWVKAGIPAPQVLQVATLAAARVAKADADLGSITQGKKADVVLVEGNPTVNIGDIRQTRLVIKGGTEYNSAEVYRALGIRP